VHEYSPPGTRNVLVASGVYSGGSSRHGFAAGGGIHGNIAKTTPVATTLASTALKATTTPIRERFAGLGTSCMVSLGRHWRHGGHCSLLETSWRYSTGSSQNKHTASAIFQQGGVRHLGQTSGNNGRQIWYIDVSLCPLSYINHKF
jgi:hypothetical protein